MLEMIILTIVAWSWGYACAELHKILKLPKNERFVEYGRSPWQ